VPKAPAIKNGNTERVLGDFHTGSNPVLTTKIKNMRNFDKEWRDWKFDMIGFLLVGLILGFCIGILI
jgi:hypothetical protein